MHARLVLGVGKGVLFREVRGVLIERDSTDMYVLVSSIGIDQLCYFFGLLFSLAVPIILSTLTYYSRLFHIAHNSFMKVYCCIAT